MMVCLPANGSRRTLDFAVLSMAREAGWGLLHELLMPLLRGSGADSENHMVPVAVRQDLRINMTWTFEEANDWAASGSDAILDVVSLAGLPLSRAHGTPSGT